MDLKTVGGPVPKPSVILHKIWFNSNTEVLTSSGLHTNVILISKDFKLSPLQHTAFIISAYFFLLLWIVICLLRLEGTFHQGFSPMRASPPPLCLVQCLAGAWYKFVQKTESKWLCPLWDFPLRLSEQKSSIPFTWLGTASPAVCTTEAVHSFSWVWGLRETVNGKDPTSSKCQSAHPYSSSEQAKTFIYFWDASDGIQDVLPLSYTPNPRTLHGTYIKNLVTVQFEDIQGKKKKFSHCWFEIQRNWASCNFTWSI